MNILTKIKKIFAKKDSGGYHSRQWFPPYASGSFNKLYKSYAFACINLRAENLSSARISLYQDLANGKTKEIFDHPFIDLMKRENGKGQTFTNLLYRIATSLDLYGNAYLYIQRDITSGSSGTPFNLYYLPFKQVTPVLSNDFTVYSSFNYSAGGQLFNYPAEDIIHFQIANPDSNLVSMGIIEGFNDTLEIDFLQERYQKNYFKNNAALGLVIEHTDPKGRLNEEEFERLKQELQEQYSGTGNAGKTMLLEGGLTAKPFTNHLKDSSVVEARKQTRDDILSMFRVPKTLLGISDDVNLANANIALNMFTNYVIKPFAKINIVDRFNSFIAKNYSQRGLRIEFDYDTDVDRELVLKTYDLYMKYGIATKDEIRALEGFGTAEQETNNSKFLNLNKS